MKKIYLIRHAATESNVKRLYLGQRDEPLCALGVEQARAARAAGIPKAEKIFASPLTRCLQTARILFPDSEPEVIREFIEIDFGRFEGKHHDWLIHNDSEYPKWLDSGGVLRVPGGECMAELKARCRAGFFKMLASLGGAESAALVVHGGTVMALLHELGEPPRGFYAGITKNCGIVPCRWDGRFLRVLKDGG